MCELAFLTVVVVAIVVYVQLRKRKEERERMTDTEYYAARRASRAIKSDDDELRK